MAYDLSGASEEKWQSAKFDSLGEAILVAVDWVGRGYKDVKIMGNDGSKIGERAISDIHEAVKSGALHA